MSGREEILGKHGGYRKLKSFRVAELVYDVTVRFCECYVDRFSRTRDQMVQAARSGVQNIAEGSQASGTSKKTELKLTNVARASLEELRRDYEDFLRQRGIEQWRGDHPSLVRFKARRCGSMEDVRKWIAEEAATGEQMRSDTEQREDKGAAASEAVLAAHAALSLLNVCCYLLDRQLAAQADSFEREGGFSERLYRVRRRKLRGS